MYCSRNEGDTVSTLATLSKPSASSSFGSSAAASTSHAQQVLDRVGVLSAIEAMQRNASRDSDAPAPPDPSASNLDTNARSRPPRLGRPARPGRRHQPAAKLAHHLFPYTSACTDRCGSRVEGVQGEISRFEPAGSDKKMAKETRRVAGRESLVGQAGSGPPSGRVRRGESCARIAMGAQVHSCWTKASEQPAKRT